MSEKKIKIDIIKLALLGWSNLFLISFIQISISSNDLLRVTSKTITKHWAFLATIKSGSRNLSWPAVSKIVTFISFPFSNLNFLSNLS